MKLAKEIIIIISVSVVLAFVYNWYQAKPLPLIYTPKTFDKVSDSELFGNDSADIAGDSKINIAPNKAEEIKDEEIKEQKQTDANSESLKAEEQNNDGLALSGSGDIHNRTVTYSQMLKILNSPQKFQLIDARNHEQFSAHKIGNAVNIFPYNENFDEVANKILSLAPEKTYIIYCEGGECDSSHKLADMMIDFGFTNLYIYTGGWEEWTKKQGLEL